MNKKIVTLILLIGLVLALGYVKYATAAKKDTKESPIVIGFSMATLKEERWQRDRDLFIKRAKELGAAVIVEDANADSKLQERQVESLILQGVDTLVVVPEDEKVIAPLVKKAHENGIKVVAYDRLISDCELDAYITFDYVKAGQQQAEAVLKVAEKGNFAIVLGADTDATVYMQKEGVEKVLAPKVEKGEAKIVFEEFTSDWKPEVAYQNIKKYLQTNTKLDGVISLNDGMAFGVIQALQEYGLAGKIPVSGMDAELAACQRIVEGTQTQTSYLPVNLQAYKAAEVAVALAKSQEVKFNGKTNNKMIDVPTYFLEPISVTKDNMMDTIIKDGFHSYEEVYKNVPENKRPPKK